jgi:hypothetical protein
MIHTFIEKNKRYLRFCSYVAQFSGLLLLLLGFISLVSILWNLCPTDRLPKYDVTAFVYKNISPYIFRFVFPGLFLLGINQLIKCVTDINFKPNWILKFSDKIIYLYVAFLIINFTLFSIYPTEAIVASPHHYLATLIPSAIFTSVKALLWVGMAKVLRGIVPIIQESKSLI